MGQYSSSQSGAAAVQRPVAYLNRLRSLVPSADLVQKALVLAVVIIPFIATAVAVWQVWERYVTWRDIALLIAMYVPISLGVTAGFHRMLTHRSFKAHPIVRFVILVCGSMAIEGAAITWASDHLKHHAFSDKPGDPHSPREGGFWAHMGWVISGRAMHNVTTELLSYVPDLRKDKFHIWISKYHYVPIVILAVLLFVFGGWPYVMWGLFFRTTVGLHSTWLVNSATHMWGKQRFATGDDSRNSFWVALLTCGEGWHNNHHSQPQSARHGLAWYEIDLNWYAIRVLSALGLVWDVKAATLTS